MGHGSACFQRNDESTWEWSLEGNLNCKEVFLDNMKFKLNDRERIRFWEDKRVGQKSLKEAFPQLYSLSTKK